MKGRVQLAITQDLEKAMARHPWAVAFITRKCGIWCFEYKKDRDAILPSGGRPPQRKDKPCPPSSRR